MNDYIRTLPRKYYDLKNAITSLSDVRNSDDELSFFGTVSSISIEYGSKQNKTKSKTKFYLNFEDKTSIKVTLFGPPSNYENLVKNGYKIFIVGTVSLFMDKFYLNGKQVFPLDFANKIIPVYPSIKRKSIDPAKAFYYNKENGRTKAKEFSNQILSFFKDIDETITEQFILDKIESKYKSISEIIYQIHDPDSIYKSMTATEDLKKISSLKVIYDGKKIAKLLPTGTKYAIPYSLETIKELSESMPIELTGEQKRAAISILDKLSQPVMTSSLISGDVGTGKTAVISIIAASVIKYEKDVAIMVPNTVLPKQFHDELKRFWPDISVKVVDSTFKKKEDIPTIYIGTTGLLSRFKNHEFGLVVIDEQHRFSFEQRKKLNGLNYVEATATCIPHTMGLISYSGFHIARLTKAYIEKNITTVIKKNEEKKQIVDKMKEIVSNDGKVIVIYPSALKEDGKEFKDDSSAERAYEMFEKIFPDVCECIHGKMKPDEKIEAVEKLKSGKKKILISTTVVEVGVDIKDVRLMIIASPENLGLSQLHQLRGRLARNGGNAECFLFLKKEDDEDVNKRLNKFCLINDGFELAEADLELRGMGSSDGQNQKGKTETFLLNYSAEIKYLKNLSNC